MLQASPLIRFLETYSKSHVHTKTHLNIYFVNKREKKKIMLIHGVSLVQMTVIPFRMVLMEHRFRSQSGMGSELVHKCMEYVRPLPSYYLRVFHPSLLKFFPSSKMMTTARIEQRRVRTRSRTRLPLASYVLLSLRHESL
jgi:hypothetical protein